MTLLRRDSGPATEAGLFRARPPVTIAPIDPNVAELTRLRGEVTAREGELRAALAEGEARCADARAQGRAQGQDEAERREAERVATLRDGVEQALAALDDTLTRERDLAVDIAQAVLAAIIGATIPHRELVAATAAHHAATLAQGSIVRLNVSAQDFPDEGALATLHGLDPRIAVVADPALAPGGCRFDLTLGALDASITAQATAAAALLNEARR